MTVTVYSLWEQAGTGTRYQVIAVEPDGRGGTSALAQNVKTGRRRRFNTTVLLGTQRGADHRFKQVPCGRNFVGKHAGAAERTRLLLERQAQEEGW